MKDRSFAWLLASVFLLTACSDPGVDELQQWMSEQRAQTKPRITPIPEPKRFTPQAYTQEGAADPFSLQKRLTQGAATAGIFPGQRQRCADRA